MEPAPSNREAVPSLAEGRWCLVAAALLWSTSGAFTKVLTIDTALGLNQPPLDPLVVGELKLPVQIACYRALFAGLVLLPALRRRDLSFRGLMIVMAVCFAVMNATFVTALALGTAANAILLQYTAPMWMYLASVFWLGEPADRRSSIALVIGLTGIGVIVAGGWGGSDLVIILVALASGLAYAGVVLCLRVLRQHSSRWLTVWNHLLSGLVLVPILLLLAPPTFGQFLVLILYGGLQMGLAYWLAARGLRAISPQEAGTIALLEPLLNPLWAYLVSGEVPALATLGGGALILAALAWRYWPRGTSGGA